jgi:metacaspase-1
MTSYAQRAKQSSLKQGIRLATGAATLLQGGFTMQKVRDAQQLFAGAKSFFRSMQHMGEEHQEGLDSSGRPNDYSYEWKRVFMYSGCRDDQTSADATISGGHVGVGVSADTHFEAILTANRL